MKGWSIFSHSVSMVTRNLTQALQISLIPMLIGIALAIALLALTGASEWIGDGGASLEQSLREDGGGKLALFFLLFITLVLVVQLWIFVAWHRFILLEEYPQGWIPSFRLDRILAYAGRGVILFLIAFAVMFVAGFASAIVAPLAPVIMIAMMIFLVFLVYRLAAILPAAAIGKPVKVGQAWDATRGSTGAILGLVIVSIAVQFLLQLISGLSLAVFAPLGLLFQVFVTWAMSLVNVSILTTLYGHYIEGRPID